jgi:LmbE family N-acetylglucosaminyl deacetylase
MHAFRSGISPALCATISSPHALFSARQKRQTQFKAHSPSREGTPIATAARMEKRINLIVLSPHLDDGVFSCGEAIASAGRAVVITVFAGMPSAGSQLTAWDAACGFQSGDAVMAARRREDENALDRLGAIPLWLDFLDAQYGPRPSPTDIAPYLFAAIRAAWKERWINRVCFPLGLFHSDHVLVHEATLDVIDEFPDAEWVLYEDMPYRSVDDLRDRAVDRLHGQGIQTALFPSPRTGDGQHRKRDAVACYASQLRGLKVLADVGSSELFDEEHYLRVIPAPRTAAKAETKASTF